jgi:hypothetical protein
MEHAMKKNALIVSSLAALMALSTFAQARDGFRRVEYRRHEQPLIAYRVEHRWARPEPVAVIERRRVLCPAPLRYAVVEPRHVVAPVALGLRLHGLRLGLAL